MLNLTLVWYFLFLTNMKMILECTASLINFWIKHYLQSGQTAKYDNQQEFPNGIYSQFTDCRKYCETL